MCAVFAPQNVGNNSASFSKTLITEPLTKFAKLLGKDGLLKKHSQNIYHKNSMVFVQNFMETYNETNKSIINVIDSAHCRQVEDNKNRLRPIIKTIIFCGKQNIGLRGHRDDGNIYNNEPVNDSNSIVSNNDGNFRNLLRFRIEAGDTALKNHLETTSSNATYISKTTQNDLIDSCGEEILTQIICQIKEARFYAILFDETTDISTKSQLTIIIR